MVGSSLRVHGGEGARQLVARCPRGDRQGRAEVARGHWLRPLNLRCCGGEVMGSEVRSYRLRQGLALPRYDQLGMVWVAKGHLLRLLVLPGFVVEVMEREVRLCRLEKSPSLPLCGQLGKVAVERGQRLPFLHQLGSARVGLFPPVGFPLREDTWERALEAMGQTLMQPACEAL